MHANVYCSSICAIVSSFKIGMLKSFFLIFDSRNQKFNFFTISLSFIIRREKLVQTSVKYGWWVRLCVINALRFRWWSHLLLGLAILSSCICSSSGAFLQQPLFGAYKLWRAEPSRQGYRGSVASVASCDDVQAMYRRSSVAERQSRHQKASHRRPCYVTVQLISWANACRYHRRVHWKRHTESWNLTLIDETGSVFSKLTSKPPIARSQFRRLYAYRIPALVAGRNKGNDRGETGRGQLAATTHVIPAVCMMKRLEYRPHFFLTICPCRYQKASSRRLLASLAESDYNWLLSHSVSAETIFADTSVQWMNTDRYTISVYLYFIKLVQLHSAV